MAVFLHSRRGLDLRRCAPARARGASVYVQPTALLLALTSVVAACFACTNRESEGSGLQARATASALVSEPAVSRVAPSVSGGMTALVAPPTPTAASASTSGVDASGGACGAKGGSACPLQAYMQTEMVAAEARADFAALAEQFDRLAQIAPAGFEHWASIARDGSAASRRGERASLRAACRGCHEQYLAGYIGQFRTRPL
jgi:hypothetical protein